MKAIVPILATVLFLADAARAAIVTREIDPKATDPAIVKMTGPHLAIYDDQAVPANVLLVSFGGTKSLPSDLKAFDEAAAGLGYDVLALDYANDVISTYCRPAKEKDCFNRFREENFSGRDLLPNPVRVDEYNSIAHRLRMLLKFVAQKDVKRWGRYFLADGDPDWSRVVVVGHSQGSGHAAYLGKKHALRGVVALAGPQDTYADGSVAAWVSDTGATPAENHAFLLHRADFFNSGFQLATARALLGNSAARAKEIGTDPDGCDLSIYVSKAEVPDAHMSVIDARFEPVWKCFLKRFRADAPDHASHPAKSKPRAPAARPKR